MHSWNSTPATVGPQNSAINNETLLCHPKSIKIFLPVESNKEQGEEIQSQPDMVSMPQNIYEIAQKTPK
jgi:hypothetical protein